jgi:hypothetical protein
MADRAPTRAVFARVGPGSPTDLRLDLLFGSPTLRFKGGSCILQIVDDLLPPRQFLYALRHPPAVQFLKTHSHMVSRPYPDHRKIHG